MKDCPTCKYRCPESVRCSLVDAGLLPFPEDAPCRPEILCEMERAAQGIRECLEGLRGDTPLQ